MEEEFYIPKSEITFSMKMVRFYFHRVGWLVPSYTAKLFWKLFTKPRNREMTPGHLKFIEKASTMTYLSDFYKASYSTHTFGKGETKVLLCHGWEGRTTDFKSVIEELVSMEVQVISIDFPGHGTSPESQAHLPMFIDVISSFIKVQNDLSVFVGHSLGAASIAMAVPENESYFKDKKLILMGLHPVPSQFIDQYKSVTRIGDRMFERCLRLAEDQLGKSLKGYDCHDHLELYQKNDVLLVHDSHDKIIRINRLEKLNNSIENSVLFKGKHGGHFKHYKHPDVIAEISAFIHNN